MENNNKRNVNSCYKTETVKICSINIGGISKRSQFMLDKYAHDEKISIVAAQESLHHEEEKIKLTNMKTFLDTNDSKNRGSALYVHDSIPSVYLPEISRQSTEIDSAWAVVILNHNKYIFGSVYVKHHYKDAIKDIINLLSYANFKKNQLKAKGIVLAGDFNSRNTAWGDSITNSYGRQLFEQLDNKLFKILTSCTPTFLCEDGSSYIDLFIVTNNITEKIQPCYTDDLVELYSGAPSRGHVPVLTEIKDVKTQPDVVREKLDIESTNWEEWSQDLENTLDSTEARIWNQEDPRVLWEDLEKKIEVVNRRHCKLKKVSNHSKPYWTPHLTILCNRMRKARRAYLTRNTDPRKEIMVEAKLIFDEERKKVCDNFIMEKTKALNTADALQFWKQFNRLFKKKTSPGVEPLINDKEEILTDFRDIEAKLFSTFFEAKHIVNGNFDEVFYDAVNLIYDDIKANHFEIEKESNIQQKLNSEITVKEIKWAIKHTKAGSKSVDNHNIHPKMLHKFGPNTIKLLHKLFNLCLNKGEWVWDTANVIFLKKSGKKSYSVPGSYRPISISSYVGKLLEKILSARITAFLESLGIFDANQEGFTANRNTIRYLNRLHLEIKSDLLQSNTVIGLFVDFEKAFDSVWKRGLILKMFKLEIKGKVLRLIDQFLQSRKVQLNINEHTGNMRNGNDYGLPQGSALSPVLFKIYLIDILEEYNNRQDIKLYKFADDGTVKVKAQTNTECINSLKAILDSVEQWTQKWRMVVNCDPNKTEYIVFGLADKKTNNIPGTLKLGLKDIKQVTETKVLGLLVDDKLSFVPHSKKTNQKIYGSWANMCDHTNRNHGFNQKVITQISKSYFLASLHYAGLVWLNPVSIKEIEGVWYKIIKSAVGAVFNVRTSIAEVILGLPPLLIQNLLNQIKHFLKLNIKASPEDKLREFIQGCFIGKHPTPPELSTIMPEVFKFLQWKLQHYPKEFIDSDCAIIKAKNYSEYFNLSSKSCSYTKPIINKYIEMLWYNKLKNEFLTDGNQYVPKPSCNKLPIPENTSRKEEVLLMSLMYPNNLFNDFLYRHTYQVPSPLCQICSQQEETPYHIILECSNRANDARLMLSEILNVQEIIQGDCVTILNGSRNQRFLKLCLEILSEGHYREEIIINETV